MAYVAAAVAVVKVTMPAMSARARAAAGGFPRMNDSPMTAAPTGTLTKKIHRHEMASVSAPPMIGPTAADAPATAPQTP